MSELEEETPGEALRGDLDLLMQANLHQSRLLDRNQRAIRRLEEQLAEVRKRARALEAEISQAQKIAAGDRDRIRELEAGVSQQETLRAAHETLERDWQELAARLAEITRSRDNLQAERDRTASQSASVRATLAARDAEVAALRAAEEELRDQLSRLTQETSDHKAALARLKSELDRVSTLEAEHARLTLEHEAVSARCDVALAQLAEAEQAVESAQATINAAQRLSASLEWHAALEGVLDGASQVVRFDRGTLAVVDALQDDLKIEAARNSPIAVGQMSRFKVGEGIAGWALSMRQPVLVRDSRSDPRFKASDPSHQPRSIIAVPLLAGLDGLGVLTLTRSANDPFTDQDLKKLGRIGNDAARALTNARLVHILRQRQDDLSTLVAKTKELWSAGDARQLVANILKSARELAGGKAALLALREPKGHALEVLGSVDIPAEIIDQPIAWGGPAAQDVIRSGDPWVAPMREILPPALLPTVEAAGLHLLISLPCHTDPTPLEAVDGFLRDPDPSAEIEPSDHVAGVLNIYRDSPDPLPNDQLEQLKSFADQAAAALKTTRRWERIRSQLQTTASLNARLMGRERYIQQLQYRIQQLEQELSRYKAA